jgi:hypothetical protein
MESQIVESHGVDAPRMFATATLMCVVWLGAITMLVRQAQVTNFGGDRTAVTSTQSLALLTPASMREQPIQ